MFTTNVMKLKKILEKAPLSFRKTEKNPLLYKKKSFVTTFDSFEIACNAFKQSPFTGFSRDIFLN